MYKKIMFLIITLSIIISVGNSTVVMAKENIVTEIVDFPVTINYEEYNVDDYNANDMMLCEYPMVVYKNMTYIPLTYYNCILLGLEVQLDKNILSVEKRDFGKPTEYLRDQSSEKNTKNIINMEVSPFIVNIQDNNYNDEEYPALFYKNIVYLPLTWKVVYDYMKWDYFYGKKYSDSITGIELYTDSFYYYSEGDAFFEIREDYSLSASAPYAKTYYKKDDIRIYSYIDLWYMAGPAQNNMDIIKGENKITVPGYTGHGQKRGALFTVNGEYIYTVHSDHKKYAPCKIKIDTGKIIYTDGEN